jgi:hypothetical protein
MCDFTYIVLAKRVNGELKDIFCTSTHDGHWVLLHWSAARKTTHYFQTKAENPPESLKSRILDRLAALYPQTKGHPLIIVSATWGHIDGANRGILICQWIKDLLRGDEIPQTPNREIFQLVRGTMALEIARLHVRL